VNSRIAEITQTVFRRIYLNLHGKADYSLCSLEESYITTSLPSTTALALSSRSSSDHHYATSLRLFDISHATTLKSLSKPPNLEHLVLESKVQSLVAFVGRCCEVVDPLIVTHCGPLLITLFVAIDIVCLNEPIDEDITNADSKELLVASLITRCVV
jgi:hypothetical protein